MCALIRLVWQPGRALASFVLAVLVGVVAVPAADPPARGPTSDAALAGQASAALAADPELAGLNLIVDVVHGAAEVGGPVPRMELAHRIEAVLKAVPGLTSVTVTVWVPASQDPLSRFVGKELRGTTKPRVAERARITSTPPLVIVPHPEPMADSPVRFDQLPPNPPEDPSQVTVRRIPASPGGALYLLDPVGPTGAAVTPLPMPAPAAAVGRAYPTSPPTAVPASPAGLGAIAVGIDAVRSADPRFVGLTVAVRGGTATIAGTARRVADAWDLASAIRRVPGVERVVIADVAGW
jgi:hypothetical protein